MKYLLRGILFKLADGGIGPYENNDESEVRGTDERENSCIFLLKDMK